jgi:hypothetical protein
MTLRRALLALGVLLFTSFAISRADQVTASSTPTAPPPTCPAGQFVTSPTTCAPGGLSIVASGFVTVTGTTPVVTSWSGIQPTIIAHAGAGGTDITIPGLTAAGIVTVSPIDPGDGTGRMILYRIAAPPTLHVYTKSGADGALDGVSFSYIVAKL